jgi:hypothetical protein
MSKDTKKYIRDITNIKIENIIYFMWTKGCWGAWVEKDIWGTLEKPIKIAFDTMKAVKKWHHEC